MLSYKELQEKLKPHPKTHVFQKVTKNHTQCYLSPQLNLLGYEFARHANNTNWCAMGIADRLYPKYNEFDNKLFMLTYKDCYLQYWQDNYETYIYKDGLLDKLMVIVDLPVNNRDKFLMGSYSELYDKEEIEHIIKKYELEDGIIQHLTSVYKVLTKDEGGRYEFEQQIYNDFGTRVKINQEQEYDYPPRLEKEIFNYGDTEKVSVSSY
jgi:hypothetical protein